MHAQPYLRYEPVAGADHRAALAAGTHRDARSKASRWRGWRSAASTTRPPTTSTRHAQSRIASPLRRSVSVRDAEQHGMLDRGRQGRRDAVQSARPPEGRRSRRIRRQRFATCSCRCRVRSSHTGPDHLCRLRSRAARSTYLPDPLAVEVAARVFDHPNIADTEIIRIPLYPAGDWPEARPFSIEVYDDPFDAPYFDDGGTHRSACRCRKPCARGCDCR